MEQESPSTTNETAVNNEPQIAKHFKENASPTETQEKINQRREARRRKILDNAKSRLERLGGRTSTYTREDDHQNGIFEYSDPEVEPNEIKFPFDNMTSTTSTTFSEQHDIFADEKPAKENFALKYRLHVLVSVTFTYLLALLGFMGNGQYSVFIPTGICVALEVILKKPKPVNPLTALIVTLCGLPSKLANVLWRLLSIAYDLVIDLGLSVFLIVSMTLIYNYSSGKNMITLQ